MEIGSVEYSKTAGDGPPDQVQVKLSEGAVVTVYVYDERRLIVEIDTDEETVPFRVYRNDGLLWEEGVDGET